MKTILLLAVAVGSLSPSLKAEERFRPGKWEIVFTGENPHTSTTCFTAVMMQGINGTVAGVREGTEKTAAKRRMKVENYKFDGTTLSYTTISADRTFINTASYHGDTFESLIITKTDGEEFTTRQKGRRLGDCP